MKLVASQYLLLMGRRLIGASSASFFLLRTHCLPLLTTTHAPGAGARRQQGAARRSKKKNSQGGGRRSGGALRLRTAKQIHARTTTHHLAVQLMLQPPCITMHVGWLAVRRRGRSPTSTRACGLPATAVSDEELIRSSPPAPPNNE